MEPNPWLLVLRGKHVATPNLWATALETLSESKKRTLTRMAEIRPRQETIYEGVNDLVRLLDDTSAQSNATWEVRLGNHTFTFREHVQRILKGLHAFLGACVNGEQQHLALIQIVDKLVLVIHRCRIIEELYTNHTCAPNKGSVENLRKALVNLYRTVLWILAKCLRHEGRVGPARFAINLLTPDRVTDRLSELERVEAEMFREMDICRSQMRADLDDATQIRLADLKNCLDEFRIPLQRIDERTGEILERADDRHWKEVLDWISDLKFGSLHDSIRESRASGTCEWLLGHPQFMQWDASNGPNILWLKGSGGTGKTVLTSKVVEHALSQRAGHSDEVFAYFYCSYRESVQSSALSIIRSILRQLASVSRGARPSVHEALNSLYEDCQLRGRAPTFSMCGKKIGQIVGTYRATRIVIDGLNECDSETRSSLLMFLAELAHQAPSAVYILVTSRHTHDIAELLGNHACLEIGADTTHGDIVKYVEEQVHGMHWRDDLKRAVKRALTPKHRHGGMFQWVALQLRQLGALSLQSVVRDQLSRLNVLPTGLEDAYDRVYRRLSLRHESERQVAIRILQWIQCSAVPPTTAELRFAVQEDITKYSEDLDEDLTDGVIMTLTSHLVEKDRASGTWRFTHFSVLEYLESCHSEVYNRQATHEKAAYLCLYALIQGLAAQELTGGRATSRDAFAEYAKWCWPSHLRALVDSEPSHTGLTELLQIFFGTPQKSGDDYYLWAAAMQEESPPQRFSGVALSRPSTRHLLPASTAAFGLCMMGITLPLYNWITAGMVNPDGRNGENWCLFSLAVFHGQSRMWRFLLHHGAECNGIDGSYYGGPLATAAATSASATEDLLNSGGNPNLSLFSGFETPLASAAMEGEVGAMEVLLQRGADPNTIIRIPSVPSSALGIAAWRGNVEAAQKLIEFGATVDMDLPGSHGIRPRYSSALAAAAGAGRLEMVRILVGHGAEITKPLNGTFGSALAAACGAFISNPDVVHYLLDHGDEQTIHQPLQGVYGSALVAAIWARKGRIEDFQEELEEAAEELNHDPDRFGEFAAVLHDIIEADGLEQLERGDPEIVEILLNRGARVTMPLEGLFQNAFWAAVDSGNDAVIELICPRVQMELEEREEVELGEIYDGEG